MDKIGKDEVKELADEQLEGIAGGGIVIELPEDDGGSNDSKGDSEKGN